MDVNITSEHGHEDPECVNLEATSQTYEDTPIHDNKRMSRTGNASTNACPNSGVQENKVDWHQSWEESIEAMIDTIVDHECYAAEYATKVQPQAEELMQTLHDSMLRHQ